MDKVVENWLNNNFEWFESYSLNNLNVQIVEKWILNNQSQISEYYENKLIKSSNKSKILKNMEKLIESDNDEVNNEITSDKEKKTLNMINQLYTTNTSNSQSNQNRKVSFDLKESPNQFTKEPKDNLSNQNERANKFQKPKLKKNSSLELIDGDDQINENQNDLLSTTKFNFHKKLAYSLDIPNSPVSKKKNLTSMRKYHTLNGYDTKNSLNNLKFLIESKIKLPFNLNTKSLADKLKIGFENRNELEFLIELIKDISYELCLNALSVKIINNLKLLANAEKVSVFFVCQNRKYLSLFKPDSISADFADVISLGPDSKFAFEIPFEGNILGKVATTGTLINITNNNENVI